MLSLLQYISIYFNINIATFVGFQIAVVAHVADVGEWEFD